MNLPFAVYGFMMFGNDTAGYVFCNLKSGPLLTVVQVRDDDDRTEKMV